MKKQVAMLLMLCWVVSTSGIARAQQASGETAIVGGTLIDGTGKPVIKDAVIVIDGSHIKAVGPKGKVSYSKSAKVINVDGKTILPGLIDSHIHLAGYMPQLFLHWGVTTVYDLANPTDWSLKERQALNSGQHKGPTLYVTGEIIDGPKGIRRTRETSGEKGGFSVNVTTPEQARQQTEALIKKGVDAIKVYDGLTPPLLKAVTETANKAGLQVVGHSWNAREAAEAGQKFIEHSTPVARATAPDAAEANKDQEQDLEANMDRSKFDSLIQYLVKNGVYYNPTIARLEISVLPEKKEWDPIAAKVLEDPAMKGLLPPRRYEAWVKAASGESRKMSPERREEAEKGLANIQLFTKKYVEAGGRVLSGTDAGSSSGPTNMPGLGLDFEMQALVDSGLTPMQAILSSTKWAAELLHKDKQIGTLEKGKIADIVVVNGDPLADITALRNVDMVFHNGKAVDTTLDPNYRDDILRDSYAEDPLDDPRPSNNGNRPSRSRGDDATE